jgi:Mg-chelatase subunit ChlD
MLSARGRRLCLVAGLLTGGPSTGAEAGTVVGERVTLTCTQPSATRVECVHRWRSPITLTAAEARIGDTPVAATLGAPYPDATATTAVLFLVDTSDPGRAEVIARNIADIEAIIDKAQAHHRLGLARFDTDFELLAPIGASADELRARASTLRATGRTTELYRNAIEGLKRLTQESATRRALVLLSDGLAEDVAYSHDDVIRLARSEDIAIIGIGYARDVPRSVALQSLRRLAEESGGRYVQPQSATTPLPEDFLAAPFAGVDSGGRMSFDLSAAVNAGQGAGTLTVVLRSAAGEDRISVPIDRPAPPPVAVAPAAATAPPAPASVQAPAPVARGPATPPPDRWDTWIWYGTPAAFLVCVLAALAVYYQLWKRRLAVAAPSVAAAAGKPFAWLVRQDDPSVRYAITGSPWRIGRGKNNDLTIDDQSVSRQHAEIHRRHDGSFAILDLDSLNGVFVNEKKARQADVREGDLIDIGDVGVKFTLYDEDAAAQEPTVMVRTRTP